MKGKGLVAVVVIVIVAIVVGVVLVSKNGSKSSKEDLLKVRERAYKQVGEEPIREEPGGAAATGNVAEQGKKLATSAKLEGAAAAGKVAEEGKNVATSAKEDLRKMRERAYQKVAEEPAPEQRKGGGKAAEK